MRQNSEPVEGSCKGPLSCASKQETAAHSHSFTWLRLLLSAFLFQLYFSVTDQKPCISAAVAQHSPHIISCESMPRRPASFSSVFPPAAPRLGLSSRPRMRRCRVSMVHGVFGELSSVRTAGDSASVPSLFS